MKPKCRSKQILVIDHNDHWRDFSVRTLQQAGFSIHAVDHYDFPSAKKQIRVTPDLVILGCASVRSEEHELIKYVLDQDIPLIILSTSQLSRKLTRELFLQGVEDISEKSYDPDQLPIMVKQILDSLLALNSYQSAERTGEI